MNTLVQGKLLSNIDAQREAEQIDFQLPFRVGRRLKRAVLDAKGLEVVLFPPGREKLAAQFCELINMHGQKETSSPYQLLLPFTQA